MSGTTLDLGRVRPAQALNTAYPATLTFMAKAKNGVKERGQVYVFRVVSKPDHVTLACTPRQRQLTPLTDMTVSLPPRMVSVWPFPSLQENWMVPALVKVVAPWKVT